MPIFDQGYQHWQGTLGGHGWRWLAVTRHGVRVGLQNQYVRRILFTAWLPALGLAAIVCVWGMVENPTSLAAGFVRSFHFLRDLTEKPLEYRAAAWTLAFHVFLQVEIYFAMMLVLLVGPVLISQDLRFNALPLYFSRPVRRIDYFLGKLGVIGFFLGMVTVVPAVAAWFLGVLFSLDFTVIGDTFRLLLAVIGYGVVVTVSAGSLMLALSSLTRNSRYVAVIWAGVWLLTLGVSALLNQVHREQFQRRYYVNNSRLQQLNWEVSNLQLKMAQEPVVDPQQRLRDQEHLNALIQQQVEIMGAEANDGPNAYEEEERTNWRPLVSYTANLQRIGFALLGSRAAWEKVDQLQAARFNQGNINMPNAPNLPNDRQFHKVGPRPVVVMNRGGSMASQMVPAYPWYWSAILLTVLVGISAWILNHRVRSLDRLR